MDLEKKPHVIPKLGAFVKLQHVLKNTDIPINLKRKVYETCIVHVATSDLEVITLMQKSAKKLRVCKITMVSPRDRPRNEEKRVEQEYPM